MYVVWLQANGLFRILAQSIFVLSYIGWLLSLEGILLMMFMGCQVSLVDAQKQKRAGDKFIANYSISKLSLFYAFCYDNLLVIVDMYYS